MLNHDRNRLNSLVASHGVIAVLEELLVIATNRILTAEDSLHACQIADELRTTVLLLKGIKIK